MSLLVICEILQLFVNTLTADGKYSLRNSDNLMQLIQMELYEKQKVFSEIFLQILKSKEYFETFEKKKHDPQSLCIS